MTDFEHELEHEHEEHCLFHNRLELVKRHHLANRFGVR